MLGEYRSWDVEKSDSRVGAGSRRCKVVSSNTTGIFRNHADVAGARRRSAAEVAKPVRLSTPNTPTQSMRTQPGVNANNLPCPSRHRLLPGTEICDAPARVLVQ